MKDNNESKAQRGKKVQIPAQTWNGFVEASRHHKRHEKFVPHRAAHDSHIPSDLIRSNNEVMLENASAYNFTNAFYVVEINGTIIDHALDPIDNNRRIGLVGFTPTSEDAPCAIVQVPLEIGDIGRAITSGNSTVKVLMADLTHEWANPTVGENAYMTSAGYGQARILWHGPTGDAGEEAAGIRLAIVNLVSGQSTESIYYGDGIAGNITGCLKIEPVSRHGASDAPESIIRMLSWDATTESWKSDTDYGTYGPVQFWIEEGRYRLSINNVELFEVGFDRIKRLLFSAPHPDGTCEDYYVVAISCAECAGETLERSVDYAFQVEPGEEIAVQLQVISLENGIPPSQFQIDVETPEGVAQLQVDLIDPDQTQYQIIDQPANSSPQAQLMIDPVGGSAIPNVSVPLLGQYQSVEDFSLFSGNPNGIWKVVITNHGLLPIVVRQMQLTFGAPAVQAQFVIVNEEVNDLQFQVNPETVEPAYQYSVDWGDGSPVEWLQYQVGLEITHNYAIAGTYDVILRSYDRSGQFDEYTTMATVGATGTSCATALDAVLGPVYSGNAPPDAVTNYWYHFPFVAGMYKITTTGAFAGTDLDGFIYEGANCGSLALVTNIMGPVTNFTTTANHFWVVVSSPGTPSLPYSIKGDIGP